MGPHGGQQLPGGQAVDHRRGKLGDHVGGPLAHELGAQNHACLLVGHHLDKAPLALDNHRTSVGEHDVLAHLYRPPGSLGLVGGESHAGDLRVGVDAGGDGVQVGQGIAPGQALHAGGSLGGGHMGQLDAGGHVAHGVHAGHAGLEVLVHQDAAPLLFHGEVRAEQPLGVGTAADGAQHHLALDLGALALLGKADGVSIFRRLHLFHPGSGEDLYAPLFQNHAEILAHLPVHVG